MNHWHRIQYSTGQWHFDLEGPMQGYDPWGKLIPVWKLSVTGAGGYMVASQVPLDILINLADGIYRQAGKDPREVKPFEVPKEPEPPASPETFIVHTDSDSDVQAIKARMLGGK